jgi:hypothetical protein
MDLKRDQLLNVCFGVLVAVLFAYVLLAISSVVLP